MTAIGNTNLKKLHDDLALFSMILFPHRIQKKYGVPNFHKGIYSHILENHERSIYVAPRGHAKSTILSFVYILHQALFEEREFIMIISDTLPASVDFLEAAKNEMETKSLVK